MDVYETVDFDGDPGFEKSGKRGDGKGGQDTHSNDCFEGGLLQKISTTSNDDGMNFIRMLLSDRQLVPGVGATERELAKRVDVYGGKMKGQQRLEDVPRTLAENAAVGER